MSVATQAFPGVTSAQWQAIKAAIQQQTGIALQNDSGEESAKGITLAYEYDGPTQTLTVTVAHREWFDPSVADIEAKLAAFIAQVQGPTGGDPPPPSA